MVLLGMWSGTKREVVAAEGAGLGLELGTSIQSEVTMVTL